MDKKEWEMLFDANAKLNSPEVIAFREQLADLQRRCDEEAQSAVPTADLLELLPYIPSTAETVTKIKEQLHDLQTSLDAERQARMKAEQQTEKARNRQTVENRVWQIAAATIGLLTLAATILFGVLALLR